VIRQGGAAFSTDRVYRYRLWRHLGGGMGRAVFVGLNPSTADECVNDSTVARGIGFAQVWGYGSLEMLNIFAFRAKDPRKMYAAADPIGPMNDEAILKTARDAALVVAAWGTRGAYRGRGEEVRRLLDGVPLHHLGLTKDGHPRHPLYLRGDTKPRPWTT